MTNKTIYNNINRLLNFINYDIKFTDCDKYNNNNIVPPITLLEAYSRQLDYHGLPKEGLSYLLVDNNEFEELEDELKNELQNSSYNSRLYFYKYGYNWVINNEGVRAKLLIPITICKIENKDNRKICYLQLQDHFDDGNKSPLNNIKNFRFASTGKELEIIMINTSIPYNHFIVINEDINIEENEILAADIPAPEGTLI